jgi:hypothetical protein
MLSSDIAAPETGIKSMRAKAGTAEFTGSSLNLAGITKKLTGKPTFTVGRFEGRSERNSRVSARWNKS